MRKKTSSIIVERQFPFLKPQYCFTNYNFSFPCIVFSNIPLPNKLQISIVNYIKCGCSSTQLVTQTAGDYSLGTQGWQAFQTAHSSCLLGIVFKTCSKFHSLCYCYQNLCQLYQTMDMEQNYTLYKVQLTFF